MRKEPFSGAASAADSLTDRPSSRYPEIEALRADDLSRAQTAPTPTKFTQQTVRSWRAKDKERDPIISPLIGALRPPPRPPGPPAHGPSCCASAWRRGRGGGEGSA